MTDNVQSLLHAFHKNSLSQEIIFVGNCTQKICHSEPCKHS